MGTRSLTRIIPRQEGLSFNEGHEKGELAHVNMYRQLDGYPQGHGLELAEFLKDSKFQGHLTFEYLEQYHKYYNKDIQKVKDILQS